MAERASYRRRSPRRSVKAGPGRAGPGRGKRHGVRLATRPTVEPKTQSLAAANADPAVSSRASPRRPNLLRIDPFESGGTRREPSSVSSTLGVDRSTDLLSTFQSRLPFDHRGGETGEDDHHSHHCPG